MKKIALLLFCVQLLAMPVSARSEVPPPDVLIKDTVHEVMEVVNNDRRIVSNQKRLLELVDAKILPHFDFQRMTQLAVGRGWRTTTEQQKQALVAEFRTMLVRTYTKVFSTYPDPKVEVKPVRMDAGAVETTVNTLIRISSGRTVVVDYEMKLTETGWKAFDVTVEGVSLVTSYRGSFADQIQQTGIDGLIKALAAKNLSASNGAAYTKAQTN
ncbi:MAG: ABC transporter substrate-binding protein [Pseudomonadota bacterium]